MKGLSARGLCLCNACATSSLPVPDSPLMSTVMLERASLAMARNTSCIAGASPIISGVFSGTEDVVALACCLRFLWPWLHALRTKSTASSTSKGLGKYSNAPPWKADTALSKSEWAVMMIMGKSGCLAWRSSSNANPSMPGMRMSVRIASGCVSSSASNSKLALGKQRVWMDAFCRAFSKTQRMERSSSTTQT